MLSIKTLSAGLVLGGAIAMFATNYHVIQTNEGMIVLPRSSQPPLRSSYVDVRQWNLAMWQQYPEVSAAMVKSGRTDLVVNGAMNSVLPSQTQPTVLEKFGQSVSEKTKEAYKSLVPIKYTNQNGEEMVLPEGTSQSTKQPGTQLGPLETFLGESSPTIPTPPQYQEVATNDAPIYGQAGQFQQQLQKQVISENFKLPQLQNPIPIQDDPFIEITSQVETLTKQTITDDVMPAKVQQAINGQEGAQEEWVKGVLNSLIPQDQSGISAGNYGQADIPLRTNAPNPLEELGQQTSTMLEKRLQEALPSMKPF